MKKALTLLCMAFFTTGLFAQSFIPFQGVARDTAGSLLANQTLTLRISVIDSIATGPVVYQETQTVTTNNLGLFTLSIGSGSSGVYSFSSINWGSNPKFVKLELNLVGAMYTNLGTSQFQSVPYALYAANGGGGGASAQPSGQIAYGTGTSVTSDGGFTRNPASQQTIITDNFGTQGITKMRIDSTKIFINYSDYASGDAAGFFSGPAYPDWNLNSICVASVVYDQANQIKYGYYAVADSSQMVTGATIGGAVVGTKLYSAYMDVAMVENPNSPFNSLTVDTNGLHWMYRDTDRITFPNSSGSAGQVMVTDGSGTLSFASIPTPTFNSHQILAGTGSTSDTITVTTGKNNIYEPTTSVTSLAVHLPSSPNDGDMFVLTLNTAVSSISFLNGTVSAGAQSVAVSSQQKTYTYDVATTTWH